MVQEISARIIAAAVFKAVALLFDKVRARVAEPPTDGEVYAMSADTERTMSADAERQKGGEPAAGAEGGRAGRKALFFFSLATDAMLITAQVTTSAWGIEPFTRNQFLSWTIAVSMFAVAGAYAMLLKGTRPQRVLALKLLPVVALVLCLDAYTSANFFATQFNKDGWVQRGTANYLQDAHDRINRVMIEAGKEQEAAERQVRDNRRAMNLEETGFRDGHAPGRGREFAKLEGELRLLEAEAERLKARNDEMRRGFNDAMQPVSGVPNPDAGAVQGVRDRFNTALRTLVPPRLAELAGVKPLDALETYNQHSTSLLAMLHDLRRGDPGAIVALFIAVILELLVITLSAVTIGLSSPGGFPNLIEDYKRERQESVARARELAKAQAAQRLMFASNQQLIDLESKAHLESAVATLEQRRRDIKLNNLQKAQEAEAQEAELEAKTWEFTARKNQAEFERQREAFEQEKRLDQIERERATYKELSSVRSSTEKLDLLWELSRFPGMTREEWAAKMEHCTRSARFVSTEHGDGYCVPLSVVRKQQLNPYFMLLHDKGFVSLVSNGDEKGVEWFYLLKTPLIFGSGPTQLPRKERMPVGKVHEFGRGR